jgi:peptidoglycan/xylan/chitin deacetylase (PgdA/CDA1 family)
VLKEKIGIFFVMGNYIGGDNSFDLKYVPKLEKYCTWEQIHEMCEEFDFEIGWHTWSHPDLRSLTKEEIIKEITPPFPMRYFAYPYGHFNDLVIECVKEVGFEKAWSVHQGSRNPNEKDYNFKIYRPYL